MQLDQNRTLAFSSQIDGIEESKIYNYSAILVYNPFQLLFDENGKRQNGIFTIEPSIRVGIKAN